MKCVRHAYEVSKYLYKYNYMKIINVFKYIKYSRDLQFKR